MVLPAYVLDAETGETLARFGLEHEPGEYRPERWGLARTYRIPAVGPGGHLLRDWAIAVVMLSCVFGLLWSHV